jgi:hypothetical protein
MVIIDVCCLVESARCVGKYQNVTWIGLTHVNIPIIIIVIIIIIIILLYSSPLLAAFPVS